MAAMSAAQQGPRVDALTTAEFLTLLWPPCEDDSYRGHINIWTLEGRKSNWFALRQTCRAAETAVALARKANVYFGTALIDFEARKRIEAIEKNGAVDVAAIRGTSATAS